MNSLILMGSDTRTDKIRKIVMFCGIALLTILTIQAFMPHLANAAADAGGITKAVNEGTSGVYGIIKSCIPAAAALSLVFTVLSLVFFKDPQQIKKATTGALIVFVVLAIIYFAPTIIDWWRQVMENAGGGTWKFSN